jgi:zinc transport system permease protein
MLEILQYQFMQNALMAAVLVSIACGIVGTYVVVKKIVFISGGVAHAAFGGIGLGYWMGINPIAAAVPFSIASAVGIGIISKKLKTGEDTAIGVIWTVGMALGIVFIRLSPGYAPDLLSYLFGSILTVPDIELVLMLILDMVILGMSILFFREFVALSFDEEFATVVGVPTSLYVVLLCLVGLSVVVLIRVVGVILVIALLSMPAAISRYFTYSIKRLMIISTFVGILVTVSGLFISYVADLPSGATIVLVLGGVMGVSSGLNWLKE